jgi:hypothetical protein
MKKIPLAVFLFSLGFINAAFAERCNLAGSYAQQRVKGSGSVSGNASITCDGGVCAAHSNGGDVNLRPLPGTDNAYMADGWGMSVTVTDPGVRAGADCRKIELERADTKDIWSR